MFWIALATDAMPFERLADYGALGIFLLVALYAIKTLWGREDKRQEQRDKQYDECLKLYQESLKKFEALQEVRVAESKQYAENSMATAREAIKVAHQNTTTSSQVTEWMERLEGVLEKFRHDIVASIKELHSEGDRQDRPSG